jgi:hypothetical protein
MFHSFFAYHVFFNERAQDNAYFFDKEEKYSCLAGRKKNQKGNYRCALKLARHLAPAKSQSENYPLILITSVGMGDCTGEDPTVSLFPNFSTDEKREGAGSFVGNVLSREYDDPPIECLPCLTTVVGVIQLSTVSSQHTG